MKGFALETGFFMCTEASPRCFVIQQVNDVDNALKSVPSNSGGEQPEVKRDSATRLPVLPWWFTNECKQQLLNIPSFEAAATGIERVCTPDPSLQMTAEQVKNRLKSQLEYYFSRENLINDRYLRCQMDADQFVPIKIVAGFPKIAQLTADFDLIVQILKDSEHVQVDETGEKVRPNSKRCTIILREIPESADENEVKSMFEGCPQKYQSIIYGLNGSWYITFSTEEDTRLAFIHLQNLAKTFNDKPVHARIKTGGAPVTTTESTNGQIIIHDQYNTSVHHKNSGDGPDHSSYPKSDTLNSSYNLGLILAQFGYVPRCTFRPSLVMKSDGEGGLSVNVPISIHTNFHGGELEHQLPPATLLSNISADNVVGDECIKENVQPSHYSVTTTSGTTKTSKRMNLDNSAHNKAAGFVQQTGYDGFLLTNTTLPNYGIPNFGRQRITDVPRMNNKNGRRSPLMYASPIMYATNQSIANNNNNNNYYFNNNVNFYKLEETTYHKKNYSSAANTAENRRFDSNRNKETSESTTIYPVARQTTTNYNSYHSNNTRNNYPSNHCSAGFSDKYAVDHKPYRHKNNYQQERFQSISNNGNYIPPKQQQVVTSQAFSQHNKNSEEGKPWKPHPYSRHNSYGSNSSNRRESAANINTNWRKGARTSLDNDPAAKHCKPVGAVKPLSQVPNARALDNSNTSGSSLSRSLDGDYQNSTKGIKCEEFSPKLDKSYLPNDRQKKRSECSVTENIHEEPEYNFVEVEFPSLVEGDELSCKKSLSSTSSPPQSILIKSAGKSAEMEAKQVSLVKNPVITKEHKVQFSSVHYSAVVAGIRKPSLVLTTQPEESESVAAAKCCSPEQNKCSYAQTLKKHK